jgi:hypothetical protein
MLKTVPNFITHAMLILALTLAVTNCSKKEEPRTASPQAAPVAQAPASKAAPAPLAQPVGNAVVAPANANPADSYVISADPELKGRLGRLVVAFPEGSSAGGTRIDVYKSGENSSLAGGFGSQALDLLPGTYSVVISAKRVEGVTIQSAHVTKMKVGVLRVTAGGGTRVDVLDPNTQQALVGGFGNNQFGLPIGKFNVRVAGQSEAVTIQDGKIKDF